MAEPEIFDYFPEAEASTVLDLGFDVIPKLVGRMRNYSIRQLIDIGTPENYRLANRDY